MDYLERKHGGSGMKSIEEVVRLEECSMSDYEKQTEQKDD